MSPRKKRATSTTTRKKRTAQKTISANKQTRLTRKKRKKKTPLQFNFPKITFPEKFQREISISLFIITGTILFLSFYNLSGKVGEQFKNFFLTICGWGIFIIPFILISIAIIKIIWQDFKMTTTRQWGLFFMLGGILWLLHLNTELANNEAYLLATKGQYGGYLGHLLTVLLRIYFGEIVTAIIMVILVILGFLLFFNINLADIQNYFFGEHLEKEDKDNLTNSNNNSSAVTIPLNNKKQISKKVFKKIAIPSKKTTEITINTLSLKNNNKEDFGLDINLKKNSDQARIPPQVDLLNITKENFKVNEKEIRVEAEKIKEKLAKFKIPVQMVDVNIGPTVIRYTLKPADHIPLKKITNLSNDLALALAAQSIRIEAPIPGKSLVGIELPNEHRITISMGDLIRSKEFKSTKGTLKIILGRDVSGIPVITDLTKMPHLLIAGQTGSGKSVGINTLIISLLYQYSHHELGFIMVDPKMVELSNYNNIPHLLTPVISNTTKTISALKWSVNEMERRYSLLKDAHVRNIKDFNKKVSKDKKLPYIVIIIDELADLMMTAGKEVEALICRLAQKARAIGIHLILATQRPSVNIITGLIKANIPSRIAYTVTSYTDSKTILDYMGAEKLLGMGDMLFQPGDQKSPTRVQGVFISTEEVNRIVNSLKINHIPSYNDAITSNKNTVDLPETTSINTDYGNGKNTNDEEVYELALELILNTRQASTSFLQRHLKIGYVKASRIMDMLEERNIVWPQIGAKKREILVTKTVDEKVENIEIQPDNE